MIRVGLLECPEQGQELDWVNIPYNLGYSGIPFMALCFQHLPGKKKTTKKTPETEKPQKTPKTPQKPKNTHKAPGTFQTDHRDIPDHVTSSSMYKSPVFHNPVRMFL